MDWPERIKLWNSSPASVADLRLIQLLPEERLQGYRLPASAFLFVRRGEASLRADEDELLLVPFQLLHFVKGTRLDIQTDAKPLDCDLLLYKPTIVRPNRPSRPQQAPTYTMRYSFKPSAPHALLSLLERMHAQWSSAEDLDKVYVTGLFYQFVYEQFRQARLAELNEPAPDLATQAAQYIRENCRQSITLETIAGHFHYSTRYLTRVFKRRFGMTPNDYLTKTRMEWTRRLLAHTDASIREAAESVGYTDIYYFSKLFKKITGITPRQYKLQHTLGASSNRPHFRSESFIAHSSSAMDNVDNDSPYQQDGWRLTEMKKGFKPTLAASVLLSLSLLATACGGASPEAQPSVKPHASESSVPDAKAETRSYTDALNRVVTIPASPEKAVVLTYGGYLLPLGIKPIGVDQNVLNAYPDRMADVANVGEGKGNVEAVAALQPDLIIIPDFYGEETAALYEPIAPTVAVAWGGDPDVVKTLRTMGDLMNRKTEAESWIAKFEEKLQFIRDSIGVKLKPGATALTFILYNGEILAGGETGTLGELIYKDFGFELPKPYKSLANGGGVISLEDFAAQPADYFFTQMTEEELEPMYELFKSPVYQTIPAVKENRIYNVSREKWNYGPYLVEEGVDMLIEQMSKL